MSGKVEKAKEILISLIRAYLVQISVTVQKTSVNEHTMHKDVRGEYVARLDGIWQSILPRQVGKYNDKLYRQIATDLRSQFKKSGAWVVTGENLLNQINVIVLGEETVKGVLPTEGDLVIFAKVLEFLSTGLFCNKALMIDLAASISVTDMVPETKNSVNEAIIKAMNDLKSTFEQQRKKPVATTVATPVATPVVTPTTTPTVVTPVHELRADLEREYREFYTNLFSEKLKEYKEKVRGTLAVLKQHNTELEEELASCYETNRTLAAIIDELGKIRPSNGDGQAFGLTLDKIMGDEESEAEAESESEVEFAFAEESTESSAEEEVLEQDADSSSEEEEPPAPLPVEESDSESESEEEVVEKKKPSFVRRGPYGRR